MMLGSTGRTQRELQGAQHNPQALASFLDLQVFVSAAPWLQASLSHPTQGHYGVIAACPPQVLCTHVFQPQHVWPTLQKWS